jgi:cysteine desulfurase
MDKNYPHHIVFLLIYSNMSRSTEIKVSKKGKRSKKPRSQDKDKTVISCEDRIYLDNNATTLMCKDACRVMRAWEECYNPSSDSEIAQPAKKMLIKAKHYILSHCGLSEETHRVLFTSGATESNCMILRSSAEAFRAARGVLPHIIVSSVEHHSILECLHIMKEHDLVEYTELYPTPEGSITASSVENAIRPNTCLISIMYANNELGTVNNIKAISTVANKYNIPVHSDAVQIFGKTRIYMEASGIDAMSVSFHKFYGPKGVGLLILSKRFIDGYKLHSQISGSQQDGLRGGTENVPGIAAGLAALRYAFKHRDKKNKTLLSMRNYVIQELSREWNRAEYRDFITICSLKEPYKTVEYLDSKQRSRNEQNDQNDQNEQNEQNEQNDQKEMETKGASFNPTLLKGTKERPKPIFVLLGPKESELSRYLPNTLLIAFINPRELPAYDTKPGVTPFCNVKLKKALDKARVIVSIASACLTSSDKASHVLSAIGAPSFIKRGVIRVSFGDNNTMKDAYKFVKHLKAAIYKQI